MSQNNWICSQDQKLVTGYLVTPSTFSASHCRHITKVQSRTVLLLSANQLSAKALIILLVKSYTRKKRCLVFESLQIFCNMFLDCRLILSRRGSKWNRTKCQVEYDFRHLSNVNRILTVFVMLVQSVTYSYHSRHSIF